MPHPFDAMTLTTLNGDPLDAALWRDRPVLVVNVASRCGLTPQYTDLAALSVELGDTATVLGVPCNQFGGQEPGTAAEIQAFCSMTYGVDFPLLAKQDVNGAARSPLYRHLVGNGADIEWNFGKVLVGPDGGVLARFAPTVAPRDARILTAIADAIPAQ